MTDYPKGWLEARLAVAEAALEASERENAELREALDWSEIICSQVEINGMPWAEFKTRIAALAPSTQPDLREDT